MWLTQSVIADAVPHRELGEYDSCGEGAHVESAGRAKQVSVPVPCWGEWLLSDDRVRLANQEKAQGASAAGVEDTLSISNASATP